MTTFSTFGLPFSPLIEALSLVDSYYFTLYSVPRDASSLHRLGRSFTGPGTFFLPAVDRAAKLEVRDRAGDARKPEGEEAVHQDSDDRERGTDAERRERADHSAVHAADPARQR